MIKHLIITLLQLPQFTRATIRQVIKRIPPSSSHLSAADIYDLVTETISRGLYSPTKEELIKAAAVASRVIDYAHEDHQQMITILDDDFPLELLKIPDPPVLLFLKGSRISLMKKNLMIAIIGTREPSERGALWGEETAAFLASNGVIIVSGLAKGCDTSAHEGCLSTDGITIAFVAHGLDMIYPPENAELSNKLTESGGSLVSEYTPGQIPCRRYFIERDRLQAGLSKGVIVVETEIAGGAMHTVRFAEQQCKRIACLKYSETVNHDKYLGNLMLIEQGRAIAVNSKTDLQKFIKTTSR